MRENIFKHLEAGRPPREAAVTGANEVALPVVAVTAAVLAMFGPVGFLQGVTGQFFREFGLTVCFAVIISLFDALAVAPMLSAGWGGKPVPLHAPTRNPVRRLAQAFDRGQSALEARYSQALSVSLRRPFLTLGALGAAALALGATVVRVPSGFLPADQSDVFTVQLNLRPGASLETTSVAARVVDAELARFAEIERRVVTVGSALQELHRAEILVRLAPPERRRGRRPSEIRDAVRARLSSGTIHGVPDGAEVLVVQNDISGGGLRPFNLVIQARSQLDAERAAREVFAAVRGLDGLLSPVLELRPGGRELQIHVDPERAARLGVSPSMVGLEVRSRLEGMKVAKLRENGREYDVRLRMDEPAGIWARRDREILVPNLNQVPVDLRRVARFEEVESPAKIERVNRFYAARITADLAPGADLGALMGVVDGHVARVAAGVPGIRHLFEGDAESYDEMASSMGTALLFGVVLLFLVLASLYESFALAALNLAALPLAVSGALAALALTGESLNIYSLIGVLLLLLGVATKNSILLVETAQESRAPDGTLGSDALLRASVRRLRPILMTSLALIAGTVPIAIGLNEASAQRTGMGIAIVGGTITSTLFTLFLIPALLVALEWGRALAAQFARKVVEVRPNRPLRVEEKV